MPDDAAKFQNAQDEKHVLSAALAHPGNRERFISILRPEDFTVPECKVIAYGIHTAHAQGRIPDPRSFHTLVETCPFGTSFGGHELLSTMAASCPRPLDDFDALANRVRLIGTKNRAFEHLVEASAIASDPTRGIEEVRRAIEDAAVVLDEAAVRDDRGFKTAAEINESYFEVLKGRIAGHGFRPTGLAPLDAVLHEGFLPGRISIIAARPSVGKTTFECNLMYRLVSMRLATVGMFSVEAPDTAIWDKFNSIATGIPLARLGKDAADLTPDEKQLLFHVMKQREDMPIEINDRKTFTVAEMEESIAHRHRTGQKFDVVFVDLFSRAQEFDNAAFGKSGSQTNAIMEALKRVQAIAERYQFHAVLLVQIGRMERSKRGGGGRRMRRPTEDDLYGSDAYLQVADNIFLLHRCHQFDPITYREDLLEVLIRKQRYGELTVRCFAFEKGTGRVSPTESLPLDFTDEERAQYGYRIQPPDFRRQTA